MTEQSMFSRLEDFISLAKKGEVVNLTVTLNKQIFTRKFDPFTTGEPEDEINMYILSADYLFDVKGEHREVTKHYVSGIEGESSSITKRNIYVANERLNMDYKRLRAAEIVFSEKYWD
jgi:hypothetical protein